MAYEGKMYNGFPQAEVVDEGAPRLAVTNYKEGIFAKAVLMDIPRLKGVDWLEPGTPIYRPTWTLGRRKPERRWGAETLC